MCKKLTCCAWDSGLCARSARPGRQLRSCAEQESESKSPANEVRFDPHQYYLMKVREDIKHPI